MPNLAVGLTGRILIPVVAVAVIVLVAAYSFLPAELSLGEALITLALGLMAIVGITTWTLRSLLVSRLERLQTYLDLVVSTETAPSSPLRDDSGDELAVICNTLSGFVDSLRDVLRNIRADALAVLTNAESQCEKMSDAVSQLQSSSDEAGHSEEAVHQINVTANTLSDHASQISSTIDEALHSLELGGEASSANQTSMRELVSSVEAMSENIARLQEESAQIGSVLDVIGGIAEQTNLLALNAAIEAARAGEQGRGFAVVADEVRALAHRTQDSTGEIQAMVEGLQAKAQSAVTAMEQGHRLTQSSMELSQQVESVLQQVRQTVADVSRLAGEIAHGTHSQTDATGKITAQVTGISQQIREVCASLGVIAEKAHDQQDTAHRVDSELNKICV